jgi:ATP-dependent RNA helicase DOB1
VKDQGNDTIFWYDCRKAENILEQLPKVKDLLLQYIKGEPLQNINKSILGINDIYLTKARNFSIRLIPEISFSFGLLSMVIIEKAQQQSIKREDMPWTLKALASCVREGFDEVEKLFLKRNKQFKSRVETHVEYFKAKK